MSLLDALLSDDVEPAFQAAPRHGVESAWFGHVPFAFWVVAAARPRLFVELGTHNGVSYAAFCEAILQSGVSASAFAVDTWQGDVHAGRYGDEVYWSLREFIAPRYGAFAELLRCRFDQAVGQFQDGSIDLLHIDGLHTYEAVRGDWEAWRPKLSDRGIVLFHDTNERNRDFGVWRLWGELSEMFPSFEFLHEHGLGLLAVGDCVPPAVLALCSLPSPRVARTRARFARLGERWVASNERVFNLAGQQRAEAELAGKVAELNARDREAAGLNDQLRDAARAIAGLTLDRDSAVVERERLRKELAGMARAEHRLRADLEASRAACAREAAERQAWAAQNEAAQAELADLRRRHEGVTSSMSWRSTAPIRRLGQTVPALPKAVKLATIVATGRLPGRLRLRSRVLADVATIQASRLWDANRYRARYPEVAAAGADPLWHYVWSGGAEWFDPHPLFDSRYYLDCNPAVAASGVNPFAHFLREGQAAGLDPHPLFDVVHYRSQVEGADRPLEHYLEVGAIAGVSPHSWFEIEGYWSENLRGRVDGLDPLSHYVLDGADLDPHPLFDAAFYQHRHPSLDRNPLVHFLTAGRAAGEAPCLLLEQSASAPPPLAFTPHSEPDVSIVIPVHGRLFQTMRCLTSIMVHTGDTVRYEVIVADDRPEAPVSARLRSIPGLRVEQNARNLGFVQTCNRAAGLVRGRHIVFLNNDTSVHPGWLAPLVRLADAEPRVGMIGVKLLNTDGTVQEAGGIMHHDGWHSAYWAGGDAQAPECNHVREVDVVVGACMLIPVRAWEDASGFDRAYAPAYFEEFDLAFRLRRRGWRVLYQPASVVTHADASSYGREERDRRSTINHELFCARFAAELRQQPSRDAPPIEARARPPAGGRILVIDDRVPEPDRHAGAVSTLHWLRLMRERGMQITFKPHDQDRPEPYTTNLQQMGIEVLGGAIDLTAWLAANGASLDHVWSARPGVTEPIIDAIDSHAPGRLIYFTHDLHFLREERRFAVEHDPEILEEARRLRRTERDIFRRARVITTPSADEIPAILALAPEARVRPIPLYSVPGLDEARIPCEGAGNDRILFVGGYAHLPNVDAAIHLATDIMPLIWLRAPETILVLAGSEPTRAVLALASDRIEVPGWVADLAPFYASARLTLSPIRYGAGVKGKILASLQESVAVVTTPLGNEGLGLADGIEALVADDPLALAEAALRLLTDPALARRIGDAGRRFVETRFSEDQARLVLDEVLGEMLCSVCGARSSPAPVCPACGADPERRAEAAAAIRALRSFGIASLSQARATPQLPRQASEPLPIDRPAHAVAS